MLGLFQEILPPSGAEFAVFLNFGDTSFPNDAEERIVHLVVARDSFLRLYEVRRQRRTENLTSSDEERHSSTKISHSTRLYLLRQQSLHGIVTGLASVKTLSTEIDGCDRLLVSFKDAKLALLEWSSALYDMSTVSIHSYERVSSSLSSVSTTSRAYLRTDPGQRCAALCIPKDLIAILPWYQTQVEIDPNDLDQASSRDLPYSPSFVLGYNEIDEHIRNVVDVVFLPGFNTPTIAVLFQPGQTWTGRLKETKDNTCLFVVSLDIVTRSYQVIMTVERLPYDSLYIVPCPHYIGGVIVVSGNAFIHVDHASKTVILPVSGWAHRVTDVPLGPADPLEDIQLEGSRATFIDDVTLFIVLATGTARMLRIQNEGRLVRALALQTPIGVLAPPSAVISSHNLVFVASSSAQSILLQVNTPTRQKSSTEDMQAEQGSGIDVLETDSPVIISAPTFNEDPQTSPWLLPQDSLEDPGVLTGACFTLTKGLSEPSLMTANGLDILGGFSLLSRSLSTRLIKKIPAIAGRKGIWSTSVVQEARSSAKPATKSQSAQSEDNWLFSTDATPAPGASRIATKSQARLDVNIINRLPTLTIHVAPFFDRTHVVQILTNSIRLLTPDGSEVDVIKDVDGKATGSKIRFGCVLDPYILILREDDTLGLFVGNPTRNKIRRKDMTPLGDKRTRYLAASFFNDTTGRIRTVGAEPSKDHKNSYEYRSGDQWLALCRAPGSIEIWTVLKLSLVFSTTYTNQPQILRDNLFGLPQGGVDDSLMSDDDDTLDSMLLTDMGANLLEPYLFLLFKSGLLLTYRVVILPGVASAIPRAEEDRSTLNIQMIKEMSKILITPTRDESNPASDKRNVTRSLVSFTVPLEGSQSSATGVFLTGDQPHWFLRWDRTGFICLPCSYNTVYAFTSCSMWNSNPTFLMNTEEGVCLVEWGPSTTFHGQFTVEKVRKGRTYSNVVFDLSTRLVVTASSVAREFVLYDDEGSNTWEPEAPNTSYPRLSLAALELIDPETWVTIDGYEFATNEVVNALELVKLETLSTQTGNKDFIAVATSIHRGEDLAVRGATYVFEIAHVVQDTAERGNRRHRLKLLCREDAKGPVTALCGMNGYLVSSMGQKVFVRAFDLDERLVGVAFLDAGVYITSIRCLKNFLLISDAVKSIWFVAFQEDPFKLVVLSRDIKQIPVLGSEFFFAKNDLELVSIDTGGVLRLYAYDPTHLDTDDGNRLLCLVEFQTFPDVVNIIRTFTSHHGKDSEVEASKLVIAYANGSICTLESINVDAYKRLYLLQSQLIRNSQHFAGLNPRNHRSVTNSLFGRALVKGILDMAILSNYLKLSTDKQSDIARQIGESYETIVGDFSHLGIEH
ncbi:hypothetical protein CPB86DRAFT_787660 [Serendipita vermifera]|nr:hypothetical protein CPB86DRAFT_787660 [Serendipita vermifera]